MFDIFLFKLTEMKKLKANDLQKKKQTCFLYFVHVTL